jgi:hypothetical protein
MRRDSEFENIAVFVMLVGSIIGGILTPLIPIIERYYKETISLIGLMVLIYIIFYFYKNKKIRKQLMECDKNIISLKKNIIELENVIKSKDDLYEQIQNINNISVNKITSLYSDFLTLQYDISSNYLLRKKHPAYKEAERIMDLKAKTKTYIEQYKIMQYKYEFIFNLFPELSIYIDDFETVSELTKFKTIENLQNEYDRTLDYLSKEEYKKLPEHERNQLALDRYIMKKNKTHWQIGRDYEMCCAYMFRKQGCRVEAFGIEKKLEDMGRDLIVYGNNFCYIVQCKYWSKEKMIHEKHIAQLYGSTIEYSIQFEKALNGVLPIPVFITNIELSETAKKFARNLKVRIYKKDFEEFPRIKCNINNGNKIYHLPFDQQYDRTKIENEGESYEFTIQAAVNKGFRRAFRHFGYE